jgi:membrane protease YdiL (CAAX protease family)
VLIDPSLAPVIAVGTFVAYVVLVFVLWKSVGFRYDRITESPRAIVRGLVLPIGAGAIVLTAVTSALGWWQAVLFEPAPASALWTWIVPVLLAVAAVGTVLSIDWRSPKARLLPLIAVGVLFVGFAEELVTRGILVVGLREGGVPEWAVVVVSAVLFGLLHGINGFFGQSWRLTALQVVIATLMGVAFFATRMTTGTLLTAMLLHALWDFGVFGSQLTRGGVKPVVAIVQYAALVAGLVAVWFV